MTRALAVLCVVTLCALSGCALRQRLRVVPRCADGLPPEILVDVACPPDGICGYSCLPGRWEVCHAA
jgi:hypothetical protein